MVIETTDYLLIYQNSHDQDLKKHVCFYLIYALSILLATTFQEFIMKTIKIFLCVIFLLLNQAYAQNLVTNPDFNLDTSHWQFSNTGQNTFSFSNIDSNDSVFSGSGRLTDYGSDTRYFFQCIIIDSNNSYDARALVRFDSTVPQSTASTALRIRFFSGTDCMNGSLEFNDSTAISNGTLNQWLVLQKLNIIPPANANSVVFGAWIMNDQNGAQATADFDNFQFTVSGNLTGDIIFQNSFDPQ